MSGEWSTSAAVVIARESGIGDADDVSVGMGRHSTNEVHEASAGTMEVYVLVDVVSEEVRRM